MEHILAVETKQATSERATDETLRGMVFDIQRMSINDGPGIRTTVFLKGCPLRCLWCHNPEGRHARPQLAFTPRLCIACGYCFEHCPNGAHLISGTDYEIQAVSKPENREEKKKFRSLSPKLHRLERERCAECFVCTEECYSGALEVMGKEMSAGEVLAEVVKDQPFYEESGGGMTLSGGEPLAQVAFAHQLLLGAKARGLHTCIETCGFAPQQHLATVMASVDLFLFDYKESDPERHREFTGQTNELIIENLRFLDAQGAAFVLRCPIVPGVNLREDHLQGIVALARSLRHCQGIHIMGHHALGESKRERLGEDPGAARFANMSREEVQAVVARVRELGGENVTAG